MDADTAGLVLLVADGAVGEATPGERHASVDPARHLFEVTASGDTHPADVARAFEFGALATAAQLVGAAQAMLDASVSYAKQRSQFGTVIGTYQAIKHKLADVLIAVEMARPLVYGAALALADGSPDTARDVSAAKVAATDAALLAARSALQTHGAIGYTQEHDLSLLLEISDSIAIMQRGKLVEYGPAMDVYTAPGHPYTRMLLQSLSNLGAQL